MKARQSIRTIHDFILSTYFADGLRITFGVLLPSLICAQFNLMHVGMIISLGALIVSIVDLPGPILHRRNAMLVTTVLVTTLSIITGLVNSYIYIIVPFLAIACFIFSMFSIYGIRASTVGAAALLIIFIGIDDYRPWDKVLEQSLYIFIGCIWYTILSYFIYRLRPYWLVQQALSESITEVSNFLREKSKFYNKKLNYDKTYTDLIKLQVLVHEKQDAVRDLLFKTKQIVKDSTPEGRFLLLLFVDMVDLFEQVMSTYYNYKNLHEQFDDFEILTDFENTIIQISYALDDIAFVLKTGKTPKISKKLILEIENLRHKIQSLEDSKEAKSIDPISFIALKNIEVNIENIFSRVKTIFSYFKARDIQDDQTLNYNIDKFTKRERFNFKRFTDNLTLNSAAFKHSVRLTIAMLVGYICAYFLNFTYSYWILLTILVISKPGYTLTKKRNYERILGTISGAVIGVCILSFIEDRNMLFIALLICMVGCYSFQRKNYAISVVFMTPFVMINFSFLGMGTYNIALERIVDTFIGSAIALACTYWLFPNWERFNLRNAMIKIIEANKLYYEEVIKLYFENNYEENNYKYARKEVYVHTANLASTFQRMLSEPKSKQYFIQEVHQFTALSHLLSSYIATLSLYKKEHHFSFSDFNYLLPVAVNTVNLLDTAKSNISINDEKIDQLSLVRLNNNQDEDITAEALLSEQFYLIQKVAYDINKLTLIIKTE